MNEHPRKYLKVLRKGKGWSQSKTAEEVGIGQTYYSYIELGVRQKNMSYTMMLRLAEAFGAPVQTIIDAETEYIAQRNAQASKAM